MQIIHASECKHKFHRSTEEGNIEKKDGWHSQNFGCFLQEPEKANGQGDIRPTGLCLLRETPKAVRCVPNRKLPFQTKSPGHTNRPLSQKVWGVFQSPLCAVPWGDS